MNHSSPLPSIFGGAHSCVEGCLRMQVGPNDEELRACSGVFSDIGLAHVLREGLWFLLVEVDTLSHRLLEEFGHALPENVPPPSAERLRTFILAHPAFMGRATKGEFAHGRWYAVAVAREEQGIPAN